jgi:hypothetical protein
MSALVPEVWDAAAMGSTRGSRRGEPSGNRRVRRAGLIALTLLLVTAVLALLLSRARNSTSETAVSILISGGTLSALYLAWLTYRDSQNKGGAPSLAAVADELAVAVGNQWEREAAVRRLNDPLPLPVRWRTAEPPISDEWEGLVALASSGAGWPAPSGIWATGPEELAGSGNQLRDVLERVPTGRLVVLGEPGSGKTVLMVRLVLDLLQRRHAGDAVPVLLSVASWDPAMQGFHSWLASQLLIAHPALSAPVSSGDTGSSCVQALLQAKLIMPILDGFDELPEAARGRAIAEINDQLQPGARLVMTSRTEEYRDATRPSVGPEISLAAAAVELCPLDIADVITYLRRAAGGPKNASRWEPVFGVLACPGALAQVFSNPLMVGLARSIYNPRAGEHAGTMPDPAELCLLESRESIEDHLLDAFIPAAYRTGGVHNFTRQRWNSRQAEGWLTFLAYHLEQVVRKPGFAWWELKTASPIAVDVTSGAIAGAVVGIPITLIPVLYAVIEHMQAGHGLHISSFYALGPVHFHNVWKWIVKVTLSCMIAGGFAGFFAAAGPRRSGQLQSSISRWDERDAAAGKILFGILYGITYSLIISVVIDLTVGWPARPNFVSALVTAAVVAAGTAAGLAAGNEEFRTATVAVIVIGAMFGAPFLLYQYYYIGYVVGITAGLAAGIAVIISGPDRYRPSRSIRWRPRNGIIGGIEGGVAVVVLAKITAVETSVALIFGVVTGLGAMVIAGLERVPGDLESTVSPIAVLKRDRNATVVLSVTTAVATGLGIGVGTLVESANFYPHSNISPLLNGLVFGVSIGPAAGLAFGFLLSGYGSAWPRWLFARQILIIRRRAPRRFMTFLLDAHQRGVLRQVGPVYQFRHIELQHRLASRITGSMPLSMQKELPPEHRLGRASILPRPPFPRHPITVKTYFWLISLADMGLCISSIVAFITPLPGYRHPPIDIVLISLGVISAVWFGLYAFRIPAHRLGASALWSAVVRYIAPWAARDRAEQSDTGLDRSTGPEVILEREASPVIRSKPLLIAALSGAGSVALFTAFMLVLTAVPHPRAKFSDPHSQGVNSSVFSPDGTTLAAADSNGSVYLWNLATRNITATLTDPNSQGVNSSVFSPDGNTLAAADRNGSVYLWNLATRNITATLPDPNSFGVISAEFNRDGTTLAAADLNGSSYLWAVGKQGLPAGNHLRDHNSGLFVTVNWKLLTTNNSQPKGDSVFD